MMEGLDDSGAPPQVFELARDVGVPLLIDSAIQYNYEIPLHKMSPVDETVGSRLYKSFLKGREHFYYVMAEINLVVTEEDRGHVVETGLFGLLGEDMAIVPTADKKKLLQYKWLYCMYDARDICPNWSIARLQCILDSLIRGQYQRVNEPRTLIRGLLERICMERGELNVSAEDMMNEDGSLQPDHPLVEKLGISMPTCETVVIFEL